MTAVAMLAESGVHGVTHRAVEKKAGLPVGTASNYFRSREALLVAVAERVGELHYADMERTAQAYRPTSPRTRDRAVDLIAGSLLEAATTYRDRYLAIFELRLESLRRPPLADAVTGLLHRSVSFTTGYHATLGLDIPSEAVPPLVTLYGGALFTLVTSPPDQVTPAVTRDLAAAIMRGALGSP